MKITISQILLIITVTGVSYANVSKAQTALDKVVSISAKKISLYQALSLLEKKIDTKFVYSENFVSTNDEVSLDTKNEKLSLILDDLFKGKHLSYEVYNNLILIKKAPPKIADAPLPPILIKGKVTDSKGETLIGVTVKVKGTATGTVTDATGQFSIQVPDEQSTLVFTYIGYVTKEEVVGKQRNISITLGDGATSLNEVIATGYGEKVQKRDLTGSIAVITDKQIRERQPISLADALQGQAAGVLVINDSGEPGAQGTIRIRGNGTFSGGNTPLYVIDGVLRSDANDVNPNDISSIEILKDAASASIYGSRSANGVIIITTKRGVEGKPQLSVLLSHVVGNFAHKIQQPTAADNKLYKQLQGKSAIPNDSLNPNFNADNDNLAAISHTAIRNQADLSIGGGSKNLSYYSSLMYRDDQGLIINSTNKVLNARINIDYKPSDKFKYGNQLVFGYSTTDNVDQGKSITEAIRRPANFTFYYPDGSLAPYISGRPNILAYLVYGINQTKSYNGSMYNYLNYNITKDLLFTTNINFSLQAPDNLKFTPKILSTANPLVNSGGESLDINFNWAYQAFLNYKKTIATNHTITGLLGFSAERASSRSFDIATNNYVNESVLTSNSGTVNLNGTKTSGSANSLASFFGRLGYNYKGRYIFNSSLRYDGSSRFGKDRQWGLFPSASFAWRVSDENFMAWLKKYADDAKLRFSYGVLGRENVPTYANIQQYTFGSSYYNNDNGVVLSNTFGNNYLGWENATTYDAGLDLSFLGGKMNFVVDWYDKITRDLLYARPLPAETGFTTTTMNVGSVENKGIEFTISGTPIQKKDFSWNVSFNLSFENSKILELNNHESFIAGDKWLVQEGGKLGDFYIYKANGVYRYDQSNAYNDNWDQLNPVFDNTGKFSGYTFNGQPYTGKVHQLYVNGLVQKGGDVIYQNAQKDSVIDANDRVVAGNAQPNFYAGLNNTIAYKQFSLSFLFNTTWGGSIYNDFARALDDMGTSTIVPRHVALINSWKNPGDITNYPAIKNGKGINYLASTRYLEDASFLRLSSARLAYNLNPQIATRLHMRSLQVYVYGTNLLTWTNYSGWDPEFSSSILTPGQDGGKYPKVRQFGLGLNVNF